MSKYMHQRPPEPRWRRVKDIDALPYGTWLYDSEGSSIGVIVQYWEMNGDRPAIERRHLNSGHPRDKFAYRREILYRKAKELAAGGGVFVKVAA